MKFKVGDIVKGVGISKGGLDIRGRQGKIMKIVPSCVSGEKSFCVKFKKSFSSRLHNGNNDVDFVKNCWWVKKEHIELFELTLFNRR